MKFQLISRSVVIIAALVPTTMLALGLNAPGHSAPGRFHNQAIHRASISHRRYAGSDCNLAMKLRMNAVPLLDNLMTSAISIAERL